MYLLLRQCGTRAGLRTEVPAFVIAFCLAEAFYKLHSFALECLCFLATWLAISAFFSLVARSRASDATGDTTH